MHILFYVFVLIMAISYIYMLCFCSVSLYNVFKYRVKFFNEAYYYVLFFGSFISYLIIAKLSYHININPVLYRVLFYYGLTAFPFVFLLVFLLIIWRLFSKFFVKKIVLKEENHESVIKKLDFIAVSSILVIVILVITIGLAIAANPVTTKYDIEIPRKSSLLSNLRITMASDIHVNDFIDTEKLNLMSQKINNEKGDIVIFDGDMINGSVFNIDQTAFIHYLSSITAPYGKYAVLGNHDYYGHEQDALTLLYEQAGVKVLRDQMLILEDKLCIIGREDKAILTQLDLVQRKSIKSIVGSNKIVLPMILLDHRPKGIEEAESSGVSLDISGHTHNGQVFPGALITKFMFVNNYGLYKNNDFYSIVSSGYSTWGPPIRIGTKSEIVVINVKFR